MVIEWQRILATHAKLIIVTITICTFLSLGYAMYRPDVWTASQGILIRDEALGDMPQLGRFESTDAMQTAEETILELSRFPSVLKAALEDVGPETNKTKTGWPTADDVEQLREKIGVTAPGGAQFGRTEMLYVTVKANNPDRAVSLTNAIVNRLERQLQIVRRERYVSIIAELERTVSVAEVELEAATLQIESIERKVGTDLASLRDITDNQAGEGSLVREFNDLKRELRTLQSTINQQEKLRSVLLKARRDPDSLLATPSSLLAAQPSIKRIKDGLIDARFTTSRLLGVMTEDHPSVKAARIAEQEMRDHLYDELEVAILGLGTDIETSEHRAAMLQSQIDESANNLLGVGSLRARYSNLRADIENKTKFLDDARFNLAEARASQQAAGDVSLITRVDQAIPSSRPIGPGKRQIVLGGFGGGLIIAAGLIFLLEPVGFSQTCMYSQLGGHWSGSNRRVVESKFQALQPANIDRRATDRVGGRRQMDALPPVHRALLADFVGHLTRKAREGTALKSSDQEVRFEPGATPAAPDLEATDHSSSRV